MEHLADSGAAVGQNRDPVFFRSLGDGCVGHAVLGHHPADKDFLRAVTTQDLFQVRFQKAVGEVLGHDLCILCHFPDLRMQFHATGPGVEERRDTAGCIGHVLHEDHRYASCVGFLHGCDHRVEGSLGVPQGEGSAGKVVVLQVDDDEEAF